MTEPLAPFARFAPNARPVTALRAAITEAYRRDERACVQALLAQARLPDSAQARAETLAKKLIGGLRARPPGAGVEQLVHEYALSTREGVALMCLAEALLRIPDDATRDALIRDKIGKGDWQSHFGPGRSIFVNAATWGLALTGRLTASVDEQGLTAALTRFFARVGEPVIRRAVDLAMRLMGEHFVMGETIEQAIRRAQPFEEQGFQYSYDMLGEAALTAADAKRYHADYAQAIRTIGRTQDAQHGERAAPTEAAGISIKLSALDPRYSRAQLDRVRHELLPRVKELALLARQQGIGFNIDAEEADRLDISLDLLEALALDPDLAGWDGLGFVVQAYGKRCPAVVDWLIDLGRRSGHRLMVRLVKGAYWDAEIKRAQIDGLADYPVYTRKAHTDIAYIACARRLLAAPDAVFPQIATHNALTLATVYEMARAVAQEQAGQDFWPGQYEFQCLHGMGEPLYELVVGAGQLDRPCRIYAPVGTHETLLAYLVRRLLENGANSSFVNQIANRDVPIEHLVQDPAWLVATSADPGAPHPLIALPAQIVVPRRNSAGLDLSDESVLAHLSSVFAEMAKRQTTAAPGPGIATMPLRPVHNPAVSGDHVGHVAEATIAGAREAVRRADRALPAWSAISVEERARLLEKAADQLQAQMEQFIPLIVREAGRSVPNAISEVREAVDFLRYYACEARASVAGTTPLGPVACISPWNFPLAIFTGQVAAALAAGNTVLAKPAEETPLVAAQAVRLLHDAGIPQDVVQLVPGDGSIGAALVSAPETAGVIFTGSTEVARAIQRELAGRLGGNGAPIPLIAETGGLNAMIVDSSALPEQVVADVLSSAFDSAGQRCSALRVLCLQDDVADPILAMLLGAMAELRIGATDQLHHDIGPVITAGAKEGIEAHVAAMAARGHTVHRAPLSAECAQGTFVPPTVIEIARMSDLDREVFGPVLHVLRFRRDELPQVIASINASGYALTFGLHTRLDDTVERVTQHIAAGNIYINRNTIGAVVGVQPFGGHGLSGTGPKAGGPLYLPRLVQKGRAGLAPGTELVLPGPVGERNTYTLSTGTRVLVRAQSAEVQRALNSALEQKGFCIVQQTPCDRAVVSGDAAFVREVQQQLAALPGPVIPLYFCSDIDALPAVLPFLAEERSLSVNTTAAGGNATLMAMA